LERETAEENIQDTLELDERDPGFYLLMKEDEIATVMILNFLFICF
jgi:hypothetical protein